MAKPKPEHVHPDFAREAMKQAAGQRGAVYTQYILLHFRATGQLAPGCDAKDLFAWMDAQADVPDCLRSKERQSAS